MLSMQSIRSSFGRKDIPSFVSSFACGPTILWYGFIITKARSLGLLCYVGFMVLGLARGGFQHFDEWPKSARLAMYLGPVLLMLGLYLSTLSLGYFMAIPGAAYAILTIVAGVQARRKFVLGVRSADQQQE